MDHFAGLDVSVKETSLCIVDEGGRIVREVKVASGSNSSLITLPIWSFWSNRYSLSGGFFASRSASCTAVCWPSSGMMPCAGV